MVSIRLTRAFTRAQARRAVAKRFRVRQWKGANQPKSAGALFWRAAPRARLMRWMARKGSGLTGGIAECGWCAARRGRGGRSTMERRESAEIGRGALLARGSSSSPNAVDGPEGFWAYW